MFKNPSQKAKDLWQRYFPFPNWTFSHFLSIKNILRLLGCGFCFGSTTSYLSTHLNFKKQIRQGYSWHQMVNHNSFCSFWRIKHSCLKPTLTYTSLHSKYPVIWTTCLYLFHPSSCSLLQTNTKCHFTSCILYWTGPVSPEGLRLLQATHLSRMRPICGLHMKAGRVDDEQWWPMNWDGELWNPSPWWCHTDNSTDTQTDKKKRKEKESDRYRKGSCCVNNTETEQEEDAEREVRQDDGIVEYS